MGDFDAAMMRALISLLTLVSIVFFPWPLSVVLALGAASIEPLVPLAAGIFADTLYWAPSTGSWPMYTLLGAIATGVAFIVRSRMKSDII